MEPNTATARAMVKTAKRTPLFPDMTTPPKEEKVMVPTLNPSYPVGGGILRGFPEDFDNGPEC
jgi:hypothetical protein